MRVSILGGSYQAQSLIADAQRSVNLYPEINPKNEGAPTPVTHYPRPGLTILNPAPSPGRGRCLYTATNGDLFAVIDQSVYYISPDWVFTLLGSTVTPGNTPAYMADNGSNVLLVDGSPQGYQISLPVYGATARAMTQVGDPIFLGADRIAYVDTFLVMNQPGTPNWYSTLSSQIAFNALDVGSKTAFPDAIVSIIACHRLIWLFGSQKSEIWYNAGLQGFPFQASPGVIVEHGCVAKYSPAAQDVKVYWLSRSPEGDRMVMSGGTDQSATRISTHAMEAAIKLYPRVDDAIGCCYQQNGHAFYKLHFPSADRTWVWDEATQEWHERRSCDSNGVLHRERDAFCAFAYGVNVGLDWATGSLYALDIGQYQDQSLGSGNTPQVRPIVCIRAMPHLVGDKFERVIYKSLTADVQTGTVVGSTELPATVSPWTSDFSVAFGPLSITTPPKISMRYSDTRGASYGEWMEQSMGAEGRYLTSPKWSRLGMGRDRVFEVQWSINGRTALNGVFVEMEKLAS